MRRWKDDRVRVYDSLRSAHLERAHEQVPASIIFRSRRYDFDPALAADLDIVQGSLISTPALLMRSGVDTVEINEPLMLPGLVHTTLAVAAARIGGRLRRRPVAVVSYAIENRDPFGPADLAAKARLRRAVERRLSHFVCRRLDRIAFGTAAAQVLYARTFGARLPESVTLVPALPAPCSCPRVPEEHDPDRVVFLGALQVRKGFPELMKAWPGVIRSLPTARLTIIGKGPLEGEARAMADSDASVDLIIDPPRAEIHRLLREVAVLVLLSQPSPTWREQVGLPIVEGLAHGCAVVTSTQTGLADWLADHGHTVLDPGAAPELVADRIVLALATRRAAASVTADLPEEDGRLVADRWLFNVPAATCRPEADAPPG